MLQREIHPLGGMTAADVLREMEGRVAFRPLIRPGNHDVDPVVLRTIVNVERRRIPGRKHGLEDRHIAEIDKALAQKESDLMAV